MPCFPPSPSGHCASREHGILDTSWIRSTQSTTCCPSSDSESGENLTGFDPVRLLAEPDDPILVHADVTWDDALFRVAEVIPVSVADERFDHRTRDLAYPQQRRLNRMRVCGSS